MMANLNMDLITEHNFPTRIGNSVEQDTMPDLTFARNFSVPVIYLRLRGSSLGIKITVRRRNCVKAVVVAVRAHV
ncbi:hypothetical protein HPB50_014865 [Hyalomma asiaticum]|uniref:Uncharacterized protein n=1 Tax=Hyalomma asiaticum TaxID=266040 RepID=A0ACB7TPH5_HYAAI|nr:hypothetical protein HPB50_014865 [Hyalomma asiaticum]